MMDALEQHRKNCEEMKLAAMVWWLILWYASDEGTTKIPTQHEWLTSELVSTVFEELTGGRIWYSWQHNEDGEEQSHPWNEWPIWFNEEMVRCERYHRNKFDGFDTESRMRKLLKRFVYQLFQYDRSDKWYTSELVLFHENHKPFPSGRSQFKPHREMYEKAKSELFKQLPLRYEEVCEWCRKIGTLMRPYIERDIVYIKKHYSW